MSLSRGIRGFVAIVVTSALGALAAAALAGESWTWSDRLGFGAFLITVGLGAVSMVWGHRLHQL
jgi:hypothetical protein